MTELEKLQEACESVIARRIDPDQFVAVVSPLLETILEKLQKPNAGLIARKIDPRELADPVSSFLEIVRVHTDWIPKDERWVPPLLNVVAVLKGRADCIGIAFEVLCIAAHHVIMDADLDKAVVKTLRKLVDAAKQLEYSSVVCQLDLVTRCAPINSRIELAGHAEVERYSEMAGYSCPGIPRLDEVRPSWFLARPQYG